MRLATLRKRREFLRLRGGLRAATPAFVLEAKARAEATAHEGSLSSSGPPANGPSARFGFTVTKRLGNAVKRNRIRRRLKAAVGEVALGRAKDYFDYVVIARPAAGEMVYADLVQLVDSAFHRVHRAGQKTSSKRTTKAK